MRLLATTALILSLTACFELGGSGSITVPDDSGQPDCGPAPMIAIECADGAELSQSCVDGEWQLECIGDTGGHDTGCGDTGVAPLPVCGPEECGPGPMMPNTTCDDGSVAGPGDCVRDPAGVCGWEIIECPPTDPDECPEDACGPAPEIAQVMCPDGVTMPTAECVFDPAGSCEWTVTDCPPSP